RDRHSGTARRAAVRPLSRAGHRGARHHLDPRWPRSHARRLALRRAQARLGARPEQQRGRPCGQLLSAGAVLGAFLFGRLTDRLGRKKLFTVTLVVYLLATAATGLSWNFWSFALFRMVTGAG